MSVAVITIVENETILHDLQEHCVHECLEDP
jgi:hypothetical protein